MKGIKGLVELFMSDNSVCRQRANEFTSQVAGQEGRSGERCEVAGACSANTSGKFVLINELRRKKKRKICRSLQF